MVQYGFTTYLLSMKNSERTRSRSNAHNAQSALPVFFTSKMVAPCTSFSPSAAKPAQVVSSWKRRDIPLQLLEPTAATIEDLTLVHDETFVRDVLACRVASGFGTRSPEVAASLPYTSGAMLSAARHVLAHGGAASAPCSGFHHAHHGRAVGFCTFNGLMVTACALKRDGLVRRVGILDLDMHYGDGTEEIIERLGARDWVHHFTGGAEYTRPSQSEAFLARLPAIVDAMAECDVVLYQAGADPHVRDPLGGWLTTEQLRRRDACVFERLRELGVPVAWNLAGGYQTEPDGSIPRVLEIHDNTALECVRVFGRRSQEGRAGHGV
jgi:acetoin utilization deacetylase AcuC-like enzyme